MKLFISVLAITTLLPALAWADSSRCYSIKNSDLKNHCLATTKHEKSRCYSIKDSDMKNSCLAEVGNQRSRCYSIKNPDQKQRCLAGF